MARNLTLSAPTGILPTKRKDVTAMATPISAKIGDGLEAVRDPVIDLLFIAILQSKRDINKEKTAKRGYLPQYLIWRYTL